MDECVYILKVYEGRAVCISHSINHKTYNPCVLSLEYLSDFYQDSSFNYWASDCFDLDGEEYEKV